MIIYRLATEKYKDDLDGNGAKLYGGRWNSIGIPLLYTAENISLSVLEILARADKRTIPLNYYLIKILVPETAQVITIQKNKLKKNWKDDLGYTRWMGDEFIKANDQLVIKVPSAIVDEENNYLLNTMHIDFKKVKIVTSAVFYFDQRLFLDNE